MNGRKSKFLRNCGKVQAFLNMKEMLEEVLAEQLTLVEAVNQTPKVSYVDIDTKSKKNPGTTQRLVSQKTLRWYYKQEKKNNVYSR